MAKFNKEAFTSPKGQIKWAFITGEGRKDKYSVVVSVPEAQAKEAMEAIDLFWKENKPKQAKEYAMHKTVAININFGFIF